MKLGQIIFGFAIGVLLGGLGGCLFERELTRNALIAGPYSDNYLPALAAIAEAKAKIQSGDTNLIEHLDVAREQIEHAQQWTVRFLGQKDDAAMLSQPGRFETNRTPSAAGSRP